MNKLSMFATATLLALSTTYAGEHPSWSYDGDTGPAHWGEINEHNSLCSGGVNQSPINIENTIEAELEDIKFNYKSEAIECLNNGHTVQVNFKKGNTITVEGRSFNLIQYHFHTPSENHIKGKSFPMEVHFVHADDKGNLAVVGVMFSKGDENKALAKIIDHLPTKSGETNRLTSTLLPSELLPKDEGYYRFNGSLTTPPCSESVRWYVMEDAVTVSKEQLKLMEKAMHAPNNRPLQPVNARPILN